MALSNLAQLGRIEKEIVLNDSLRIKVHTLSVSEHQRALSSVPENIESEMVKFSHLQEALLVHATSEINGEKVTPDEAREVYGDMQYTVLTQLFAEYTSVAGEQSNILAELKKK